MERVVLVMSVMLVVCMLLFDVRVVTYVYADVVLEIIFECGVCYCIVCVLLILL